MVHAKLTDQADGYDPTGTAVIRRRFRADGQRRLQKIRGVTHDFLVGQDFMGHRGDGNDIDPGFKLSVFNNWFSTQVHAQLVTPSWWNAHLTRAYASGVKVACTYGSLPLMALPNLLSQSARNEFTGIAEATIQHVTRTIASAAKVQTKPQLMYRQTLRAVQNVGNRINATANFTTVQAHNRGRLDGFRALGIDKVGVLDERIRAPKRLHDKALPEAAFVNVETAGDHLVCIICQDISDDGPYKLDEAELLIPAHPNCRCAFVPAFDMRYSINREKRAEAEAA